MHIIFNALFGLIVGSIIIWLIEGLVEMWDAHTLRTWGARHDKYLDKITQEAIEGIKKRYEKKESSIS